MDLNTYRFQTMISSKRVQELTRITQFFRPVWILFYSAVILSDDVDTRTLRRLTTLTVPTSISSSHLTGVNCCDLGFLMYRSK